MNVSAILFILVSLTLYHELHIREHGVTASQSALKTSDVFFHADQGQATVQTSLQQDLETSFESKDVSTQTDASYISTSGLDSTEYGIKSVRDAGVFHGSESSQNVPALHTTSNIKPSPVTTEFFPHMSSDSEVINGQPQSLDAAVQASMATEHGDNVLQSEPVVQTSVDTVEEQTSSDTSPLTTGPVSTILPVTVAPCRDSDALCETSSGLAINLTVCTMYLNTLEIKATYVPTTVEIRTGPFPRDFWCKWRIAVPRQDHVLITFDSVIINEGNMNIEMKKIMVDGDSEQPILLQEVDRSILRNDSVHVSSLQTVQFLWRSEPGTMAPVTFHVTLLPNVLPSKKLSSTAGIVTSPDFDTTGFYPTDYAGTFEIPVPENYSVLVKFTYFDLWSCWYDFLLIYETDADNGTERLAWKGCEQMNITRQTYQGSIRLKFVSDSYMSSYPGFSMTYVTLPTFQEPVLVTDTTYNCSVPHFHLFKSLFSCDILQECEGNEDEEDCVHNTNTVFLTVRSMCDRYAVLCETGPGVYFTTTSLCQAYHDIEMSSTTDLSTVYVAANPLSDEEYVLCEWRILVPEQHHVQLTIFQLVHDEGHIQIHVKDTWNNDLLPIDSLSISGLKNSSVNITSVTTLYISYTSNEPHVSPIVTFQFIAAPNILPSGRLSETAGFVTSPNFQFGEIYPHNYDGTFYVHVPVNSSILVNVAYMSVSLDTDIMIYEVDQNNNTDRLALKLSGYNLVIPLKTFRSSVRIRFRSTDRGMFNGFKFIYAVLPTHLEPAQLEDMLYECSVPHVDLFMPLFRCNFLKECQGLEDETGCDYSGRACPAGTLAAGRKCYTRSRPNATTTWYAANIVCTSKQQALITLPTAEDMKNIAKLAYDFNIFDFFVGLQLSEWPPTMVAPSSALYRNVWQWSGTRAAFTANVTDSQLGVFPVCVFAWIANNELESIDCFDSRPVEILCEFNMPIVNDYPSETLASILAEHDSNFQIQGVVICPTGHVTRDFLSCDTESQCNARDLTLCGTEFKEFPMFTCDNLQQSIPYSLVCDHISQCVDNSDEIFCQFKPCSQADLFQCRNKQCTRNFNVCDGKLDCVDQSDEICKLSVSNTLSSIAPPAILDMQANGTYTMNRSDVCPSTHFRCLDGYCLPVYLRCNGIADCVGLEDEEECGSYTCPGYYRCRGSTVCLHPHYMCDGVFQCPQYDDELLCETITCPDACHCLGLSFVCTAIMPDNFFNPELRYLDVSNTSFTPHVISHIWFLINARLSNIGMNTVPTLDLPNLRQLDLSDNQIFAVNMESFKLLTNLKVLVLRGNPLRTISLSVGIYEYGNGIHGLTHIDLSRTHIETYNGSVFTYCPRLKSLNISESRLHTITNEGFRSTRELEHLDMRDSSLEVFPGDLLKNLSSLQTVYVDNFVLCCEAMLPDWFDTGNCHTEENLLTSCEDLLRTNVYRVVLWILASLAVMGNVASFVGRLYLNKEDRRLGSFSVFVTNLSISDFLMGVYLSIIGVADQVYLGEYLWHSEEWKTSVTCSLAGFLSLLSSEVSAFIICLITLDRFLVIRFPFSYHIHFQKRSALVACVVAWLVGIALASVPLLPATSHWDYYSQTGICIPLPFSSGDGFPGHSYSLGVMIVLNFVLFMLIAVGQLVIYCSIRKNTMPSSKDSMSKQATVARRLTTIVVTDFLCWFPIGLLGLLAATGTPVTGEINVAVAILVLPFNSALNPFLYTFNTLMEKRQKSLEERLLQRLEKTLQTQPSATVGMRSCQ